MIKSTHMKHIYWRSLISASFKYCIMLGILFINIPFLQPNEMTDLIKTWYCNILYVDVVLRPFTPDMK